MKMQIPVLMYHEISDHSHAKFQKYTVTLENFSLQLSWLHSAGYRTVSLDDVCAYWTTGQGLPPKPVVITFDDGFASCLDSIPALLSEFGFTATAFVVAGLVGSTSQWLRKERDFELPLANWTALREAEQAGVRCEAHSFSHPRLAELTDEQCRDELSRCRDVLEDRLDHPIRHLAYPFGSHSLETVRIARELGFQTACTVREGFASSNDDMLQLPRVPVLGDDSLLTFVSRMHQEPVRHTLLDRIRSWRQRRLVDD